MPTPQVARDITYAGSVQTRAGSAVVRCLENATGRIGLIRRAGGYDSEVAQGADFWDVIRRRYGLRLEFMSGSLDRIPRTGPLVVVANHPFGILDGLMMGHILSQTREDFQVFAHRVFRNAPDLEKIILPISFDGTKEAQKLNLRTRANALQYLSQGGCIGIFPGGTVSTAHRPFGRPLDPAWRTFTAKMIARSGAQVVPVYFDGQNGRLFQMASHLHPTLRLGLLIREFGRRVDRPVRVAIGDPIPASRLADHRQNPRAMMDLLRRATYDLSDTPGDGDTLGFDFEI